VSLNQKGLSILEALITMFLILGVMIASLSLFKDPLVSQKNINIQTNFSLVRSNVLNLLRSTGAWNQTMLGANNAAYFSCIMLQGSATDSDRDCALTVQDLDIYDTKGTLIFNFQNPGYGFKINGTPCDATSGPYIATPPGNPLCPLRLDLKIQALCAASPCENPNMRITGSFSYTTPTPLPLNLDILQFVLLKSATFCPAQAAPTLIVQGADVSLTGSQVAATIAGKTAIVGHVHYSNLLLPCQTVQFNFNYGLGAWDLDADTVPDTEGIASVCLIHPTLGCLFEIQLDPSVPTFNILYQGAVVATKPATYTLASTSTLGFRIYNGRVQVCFDGICFFNFPQKLGAPFDVEYRPASTSYSSGFSNVNVPIFNSL
jgi:hypothetical protein